MIIVRVDSACVERPHSRQHSQCSAYTHNPLKYSPPPILKQRKLSHTVLTALVNVVILMSLLMVSSQAEYFSISFNILPLHMYCAACVYRYVYFHLRGFLCMQGADVVLVKGRLMLGTILYCSFTWFSEARGLHQTQSPLIWLVRMWLVLPASLLQRSLIFALQGWTFRWDAAPAVIYVGSGDPNCGLLVCTASDWTAKSSSEPAFCISAYRIPLSLP